MIVALFVFSCSHKKVEVINHGKNFYGKNNYQQKDRNSDKKNLTNSAGKDSFVTIAKGDTVYSLARSHNVSVDDLIAFNNLKAPYQLQVGQKIITKKASENNYVKIIDAKKSAKKIVEDEKPKIASNQTNQGFIEKTLDKLNHFSWPVRGEIISKFGPKSGGLYNDGINIKAKEGDIVKVAEDGIVSYVGNELKGYGNLVIVKHSGGWITAYAHLSKISVKRGQKINKMTKIGEVGSTGNVGSPQLYFGLRKGRDAVNPENYLSK
ncbi:MAG: M23 family metallopeptidase [Rickettsiales bacterium]|nr:M23 family metallopeptidase [Rickettsiales bacterium]